MLSQSIDLSSYSQAIKHSHWRDAMQTEIQALKANNTWTLTSLPFGKKPIGCKWVFKTKLRVDGLIERHKSRLVAKGYTQVEGLNYHDTFALVAKLVTVCCVFFIAAARHWHLYQLDVNNAFLHVDLDEEVYMTLPLGYGRKGESRVCRLLKSLYGLKQASRNWYSKLSFVLLLTGYSQSDADHSLFTWTQGSSITVVLVYVDDLLIAGNDLTIITDLKTFLADQFKLKDLGTLKYFLGLEMARSPSGIFLSQRKYALDILADFGTLGSRPTSCPMKQHLKLTPEDGVLLFDPSPYRRLASCPTTRRSTTGFFITLGTNPLSWRTKKQTVVFRSSAEAKYRDMATTTCELVWIKTLLSDLMVLHPKHIIFYCDNQAALHITYNPVFHEHTKHIEIDCHYVREKFRSDLLMPIHISTQHQIVDIFTKALGKDLVHHFICKLGITDLHAPT
ncbi:Retrovirus-related Pol polyprotein from transposon RE1 [Vitis vinifera]|uniref:Retrovirus-related Pol polyprotein from transposon RE1 n=1 Tax=Vitis vinifera TaxID=29760 RepID=A0A438BRK5_VITVI|nr:Retrovirus-related Pol polyprotein from transposon RE1 [Vitis vinifera]